MHINRLLSHRWFVATCTLSLLLTAQNTYAQDSDSGFELYFPVYTIAAPEKYETEIITSTNSTTITNSTMYLEGAKNNYSGFMAAFHYDLFAQGYMFGYGYEQLKRSATISKITFETNAPANMNELTFTQGAPKLKTETTLHNLLFYIPVIEDMFDVDITFGFGQKKYTFDFTSTYLNSSAQSFKTNVSKLGVMVGLTFPDYWYLKTSIGYNVIYGNPVEVDISSSLLNTDGSKLFPFTKVEVDPDEVFLNFKLGIELLIFG